jgi:hypothetical protein
MKFGLMYEIQIPKPHYPGIERDTYKQVLAQVTLAEEMGFSHFWTVEHHFLTEFSHCPAPEVLYGAVSQRTHTMRIGHAVALLPPSITIPFASPSAPRCSTSSAMGGPNWAPVAPPR